MESRDTRSLKVLTDWNSGEYVNEHQKAAALQVLINAALDEQDHFTRITCAALLMKNVVNNL